MDAWRYTLLCLFEAIGKSEKVEDAFFVLLGSTNWKSIIERAEELMCGCPEGSPLEHHWEDFHSSVKWVGEHMQYYVPAVHASMSLVARCERMCQGKSREWDARSSTETIAEMKRIRCRTRKCGAFF